MSDIMRPIGFDHLMDWVLTEHETKGSVFGVRKMVKAKPDGALPIFDEKIETPFGHSRPQHPTRPEHHRVLRGRLALLRAQDRSDHGRRGALGLREQALHPGH